MKYVLVAAVIIFAFFFLELPQVAAYAGNRQDSLAAVLVPPPPVPPPSTPAPTSTFIPGTNPVCGLEGGGSGINTAIGCIPFSLNTTQESQTALTAFFLRWALGIGGGIAFLLILYSGFLIMTSTGIPDRIKAGQELLTSALAGLILLIFAVFVLQFIGVDILHIPSFGVYP